ncbi:hypothetical protein ACRRVB_02250 [Candidatus Cardinium hertigii]|uniref:hypothetical protein n=1 Tax=Candidatus Cardinium hertigii TaxID=247481 RepID=UPI003D7EF663
MFATSSSAQIAYTNGHYCTIFFIVVHNHFLCKYLIMMRYALKISKPNLLTTKFVKCNTLIYLSFDWVIA